MTLLTELPRAKMSDGPQLASSFVGLVNGLLQRNGDHDDDVRRAINVAIRQYIADHLDDLALDVDRVRRQFFCSRATLYRLFEGDGGVAKHIRDARLRACMHDLALPSTTRKHVGLIATRWGFENPSHFNRLFKQSFGVVPSAVGGLTIASNERPRTRYHTETLNLGHGAGATRCPAHGDRRREGIVECETDVQRMAGGLPYRRPAARISRRRRSHGENRKGSTIVDTSLGKVEYSTTGTDHRCCS